MTFSITKSDIKPNPKKVSFLWKKVLYEALVCFPSNISGKLWKKTSPIKAPAEKADIQFKIEMLFMLKKIINKKTGTEALETIKAPIYACCSFVNLANLLSKSSNKLLMLVPISIFPEAFLNKI